MRAGGQGKNRIPVIRRMDRVDGPGKTGVGHLGERGGLDLGQPRVGGHDTDCGVLSAAGLGGPAKRSRRRLSAKAVPSLLRSPGHDPVGMGIDDVAQCVDRYPARQPSGRPPG